MNKKSVLTAVAVLTILGSLTFAGTTMAQSEDGKATMITRLAQKLGISEDKVKSAFVELHSEHQTEMKANMETKLSELVSQGKITEAQKTAIIAKMEEMKTKHQNMKDEMKNLTPEQRKQKMEAERAELETWAKSQGIDLSILPFGKFGQGMMKMHMGKQGRGMELHDTNDMEDKSNPTASPVVTQ